MGTTALSADEPTSRHVVRRVAVVGLPGCCSEKNSKMQFDFVLQNDEIVTHAGCDFGGQ